METEKGTNVILLDQLVQSKFLILFLTILIISYFGRMNITWTWVFEYSFYGSLYFIIYLVAIALITAIHERGHIVKLKELGYEITNFKVNRIGNVSFWIENMEQMSPDEAYQNATAPFLARLSYGSEIISLLILVVINIIIPFPLNLLLSTFTLLAFIQLLGSLCALSIVRKRKTSGFCVRLARTITSRGDIDEIVSWNRRETEFV